MKKVIAFAGSNSSTSINQQLIHYASSLYSNTSVTIIDLRAYQLPIYSEDLEKDAGFPEDLSKLLQLIKDHDAVMLSVNEHNGTVSAFFKNVLDWLSRIEYKFLSEKKVLLMSSSTGKRGAQTALEYVAMVLPRFGIESILTYKLPSFSENFTDGEISEAALQSQLQETIEQFEAIL